MADVVPLKPKDTEKPEPFRIGSTVRLNGGGAVMTVRKPGKLSIVTDWHDGNDGLCTAEFPPAMLRHADPNENDKQEEGLERH